jgi:hypothetical protein
MSARRPRNRPRVARAPAAPPDHRRRRIERAPVSADTFPWKVGELVEGIRKPNLDLDVWARCRALYGRSEPEGGTE